ncbi:unnamed protein product [Ranitomeya imitator]|uniref:RING-type E3 ubiquitin transferase n=1 Tax=Ranitomeya imitator TaxID=111125 RepID=A0ABN9MCC8_9NEOB|nr:unnamed protein product [Ranitomeya imitator]
MMRHAAAAIVRDMRHFIGTAADYKKQEWETHALCGPPDEAEGETRVGARVVDHGEAKGISPVVMSCWYWDSSPLAEDRAQCSRLDVSMELDEEVLNRILGSWRSQRVVPKPSAVVKPSMCCEASRLRTLTMWPGPSTICPRYLARVGFYYLGPGDRVQCFCCGVLLTCWEPGDDPRDEHHKFSPSCPFLLGREVGNIPCAGGRDSVDGQILGQLHRFPEDEESTLVVAYPELVEERARLATYSNWPPYAEVTPDVLARAGFFYTGHGDNVKCFHCDGELRNWERRDDPWREHAKWFPRCEFLIQSMGLAYVRGVQDTLFIPESTVSSPESQRSEDSELGPTAAATTHSALKEQHPEAEGGEDVLVPSVTAQDVVRGSLSASELSVNAKEDLPPLLHTNLACGQRTGPLPVSASDSGPY